MTAKSKPPAFWVTLLDQWKLVALSATCLMGLGFYHADYTAHKTEVTKTAAETKSKIGEIDTNLKEMLKRVASDTSDMKIEQAKQGQDIKYILKSLDARHAQK